MSASKNLLSTMLFRRALSIPLIIAISLAWYMINNMEGAPKSWTIEDINQTMDFFKVPLLIVSLIFPLGAMAIANHRSIQSIKTMELQNDQNNFANYWLHFDRFTAHCDISLNIKLLEEYQALIFEVNTCLREVLDIEKYTAKNIQEKELKDELLELGNDVLLNVIREEMYKIHIDNLYFFMQKKIINNDDYKKKILKYNELQIKALDFMCRHLSIKSSDEIDPLFFWTLIIKVDEALKSICVFSGDVVIESKKDALKCMALPSRREREYQIFKAAYNKINEKADST